MKTVGIVAEYNPFHFGHEYHIEKTRERLGDCLIVCVMSGDFVQRGEPALFSKYARAEAAIGCGADLVMELPLPWALSSAEGFARGAVGLLEDMGADHISFGSESGDIAAIEKAAEALLSEDFSSIIKKILKKETEISFAAARDKALNELIGDSAAVIRSANDTLAVEYVKAIKMLGSRIEPIAVKRQGNGHDIAGETGFLSASDIRRRFFMGEDISELVPVAAAKVFKEEISAGRVTEKELFDTAALARLRGFDTEYFSSLPDCSDGLGQRLYKESRVCTSLDELYAAAKTKKYAMSRVRRACMCAVLGIREGMNEGRAPYAKVLAANDKGCKLLRTISDKKSIPLITKPAKINKYDNILQNLYAIGVYAHDITALCYSDRSMRTGAKEWQISPKIVKCE